MSTHAMRGRSRYPGSIDPRLLAPILIPMANLALWLAADSLSLTDGAWISSWTDISGKNNHATQTTDANKPTFKTNILNGKPVARFDGGDFLEISSITANPIHLFAVLIHTNSVNSHTIVAGTSSGTLQMRAENSSGGKINLVKSGMVDIAKSNTVLSTTVFSNINISYNNPNYAFRLNQADDGAGSSAQTFGDINRVGINYNGENWLGDIAELIIYSAALSTTDRDAVESYLKTKYGL